MSDRLTIEQLDQIKELHPLPWKYADEEDRSVVFDADGRTVLLISTGSMSYGPYPNPVCNSIGEAAAELLSLLEETERLRGALEEIASRENWGIGEHEGNDATVWQGDSAPFDIARAALGDQR